METGNIIRYCKLMSKVDIEHVENCKLNLAYIQHNKLDKLIGCPSGFGLDEHIGLCEIEEVSQELQNKQCKTCWEKALKEQGGD